MGNTMGMRMVIHHLPVVVFFLSVCLVGLIVYVQIM